MRLTTGRALDSYNTGVQSSGIRVADPLRRRARRQSRRRRPARCRRRRAGAGLLASRLGRDERARPARPARGADLHHVPLPGTGRHQHAHQRRVGPALGHGRVQGRVHPDRQARAPMADLYIGPTWPTTSRSKRSRAAIGDDPAVVHETERLVIGGAARRHERRHLLLPALHALQSAKGWISPGGLNHVCDVLQVPPAEAYGVATFYEMFRVDDPDHERPVTHVCVDAACQIAGAEELLADIEAARRPRAPVAVPRSVRAGAGPVRAGCRRTRSRARRRDCAGRAGCPNRVDPILRLLAESASSTRRRSSRTGATAATRRWHGRSNWAPRRCSMRSPTPGCRVGAAPRSRPASSGGLWPPSRAARSTSSRTATSPSRAPSRTASSWRTIPSPSSRRSPSPGLRPERENGWIYIRGEYPLATARLQHAIDQARAAGLLGADAAGPVIASTSRSAAARVPTSVARRPRCSTRSRVSAVSRAASRRSRRPTDSSGSRPRSTIPRRCSTYSRSCRHGAEAIAAAAPRGPRAPKLLCLSGQGCDAGRLRGRVRHHTRRGARLAGGVTGAAPSRRPHGWCRRLVRRSRCPRHAAHARRHAGTRAPRSGPGW